MWLACVHLDGSQSRVDRGIVGRGGGDHLAEHGDRWEEADVPEALGWMLGSWDGRRVVGHDGATIGQVACLRLVPDERVAVVLLTNGGESFGLYDELFPEVLREVAGVEMPPTVQRPERPAEIDPTPYLGTYERTGKRAEILHGTGGLVLRTTSTSELVAGLGGRRVHEYLLMPVGDGVCVTHNPAQASPMTVVCYELADGTPYLHFGMRASRKVS